MSFATVKANLEKEGTSLLYKLKDELSEYKDIFRTTMSESFTNSIIKMKEDLVIAESIALHEQLQREEKPVGDTTFWYDDHNNYLKMKSKYRNHYYDFLNKNEDDVKDFKDELENMRTKIVETTPSGSIRPDLKSIVRILEFVYIDDKFDGDLRSDVLKFVKRYKMNQDLISI